MQDGSVSHRRVVGIMPDASSTLVVVIESSTYFV